MKFSYNNKNGCTYLKPNISNYSVFLPESQEKMGIKYYPLLMREMQKKYTLLE